jgi:lipid-binding SYLF domain-containing protein
MFSALAGILLFAPSAVQAAPDEIVREAHQVLQEIMAIPAKQVPMSLLAQARGVAIVPNVIKIGFVAGVRRGHGVVLVRNPQGEWSLPQFITLTGGSVGWQAGVQGSDIVLVFMTDRSIEGLLNGKFTIGADVAAAAGPVGRNAAAATDGRLKAEILSYSRSRGLFAGLAIDGSVIESDAASQVSYYGPPQGQLPSQVPESAVRLCQLVASLSQDDRGARPGVVPDSATASPSKLTARRQALKNSALQLYAILDPNWQRYLALPRAVFEGDQPPSIQSLQQAQKQFALINQSPQYRVLAERPEFQATYERLLEYVQELTSASQPILTLPPPPTKK